MKKMIFILIILLAACRPERKIDMGINLDGAGDALIFTIQDTSMPQITEVVWTKFDSLANATSLLGMENFGFHFYTPGKLTVVNDWSTTQGYWAINSGLATGTLYMLAVTYDFTSTGNDPIIYVNGSPVAITETTTPAGIANTQTGTSLNIGYPETPGLDGQVFDVKVYNRILTPGEISDLYASRCHIQNDAGLRFHADLLGASGLTSFDGAVLGANNIFVDRIGGARGTVSGNPTGVADPYLAVGGAGCW